jgi:hypothetical protein
METTKELPVEKQAMLKKFKSSGKSITQYCREENIPYHLMSYWQRKEKYLQTVKDKKFTKIKLVSSKISDQNKIEIIYGHGTRIVFYGRINMNDLKEMIR